MIPTTKKTLLAIALFIPSVIILLATLACLPAPVGNPDTATLDNALTGAWQATAGDPTDTAVALLRPYDAHTWFLQYFISEKKDGKETVGIVNCKAWLANFAGTTFICCESLDNSDFLPGKTADKTYFVAKLDRTGDKLTLSPVNDSSDLLKDAKTQPQIEAVLKANANNKALYEETNPMTFAKLDKDHLKVVEDLRSKANVGIK